ncbi:MAG TPA: thioredoxin domain-containing protein [Candidatus Saccharimonadales bacterium]|nr:thioredoxin domain-containing protein [Candidatus Saccharimonadales bacterium]
MSKRFLAVLAGLIIIFIGILLISNNSSSGGSTATLTHHVEGQGKDGITLVEYGDFQCPYCGQYYPVVNQVVQEYNQQITFQFVNFPLTSIHPNAFAGARAAEAANLQGKYWQMHDLLYESNIQYYDSNQTASSWISASDPLPAFDQLAKQLGLNISKFNSDYQSAKVNNLIEADMNEGNKLGVNATPTFYLDGKQIQPTESLAAFQKYINAAIAAKTKSTSPSKS